MSQTYRFRGLFKSWIQRNYCIPLLLKLNKIGILCHVLPKYLSALTFNQYFNYYSGIKVNISCTDIKYFLLCLLKTTLELK
jgi:hypothetical protein